MLKNMQGVICYCLAVSHWEERSAMAGIFTVIQSNADCEHLSVFDFCFRVHVLCSNLTFLILCKFHCGVCTMVMCGIFHPSY